MPGDPIRIGDLRWQVTLAKRSHAVDAFDLTDVQLDTVYTNRLVVYANIVPVGTHAYLLGQQLDIGAITHRITVRWKPTLDQSEVVLRDTLLADGSIRHDVYRVHRVSQWNGRNRFLIIDAELETRDH